MIKSLFRILSFIFIVLAIGQFPAGKDTIGGHFVSGVKTGCVWSGRKLSETKWFAGIQLPPFMTDWFKYPNDKKEYLPKRHERKHESSLVDEVSKSDREAMLKLLQ